MPQIDRTVVPRGRPPLLGSAALHSPTPQQIAFAAGVFQSAGIIDLSSGEVRLRLYQTGGTDLLDFFLTYFGGRTNLVQGERYVWTCQSTRSRGILMTFFTFLFRERRDEIRTVLRKDAVISGAASVPSDVVAVRASKYDALIIPKHHYELPSDYDDSIFLYVDDSDETVVFRLSSVDAVDAFVKEAKLRSYIIVSQIELTVSLSRPPEAVPIEA